MPATLGMARSRPDKPASALTHELAGVCTFGDATLDRLLNNTRRVVLEPGSMRWLYDSIDRDPSTS